MDWIIDIVMTCVGIIVISGLLYSHFARGDESRAPQFSRLDRRSRERLDRRRENLGSPDGIERRMGTRRGTDNA